MAYVIAYDIGTTGVKTCIFEVEDEIRYVTGESCGYHLYIVEHGEAEQDPDEWWEAMGQTTREALQTAGLLPQQIEALSFCSQMQGLVLVDREGKALRRAMSYMDQRARAELAACMGGGLQIAGGNARKVLTSLRINCATSTSVKDPVWKYKWVEAHEPEVFAKVHRWLDVKDYLVCRCTGNAVMTEDSAYATLITDSRKGREGWSDRLCSLYGVHQEHLAPIIKVTDLAGYLTTQAAEELGLAEGTPVFGGGGDASLIGVGAGCVHPGQTHIYSGTSGWVSTVVAKQLVDPSYMIASPVGAISGCYNYVADMETAGKCLEWVKDHLALDEIGVYLETKDVTSGYESEYTTLYDYMSDVIRDLPAGSNGLIFTPWLHGNRCPFEDPDAAGMFFGLRLETGKSLMIRAVVEGVCFHLRWMLECQDKKTKTSEVLRFVGGGALSDVTCQILADITGRRIETVDRPQNVGSVGAAAVCGVGLGIIDSIEKVGDFVRVSAVYEPDPAVRGVYDRNYKVFRTLYASNRRAFRELHASVDKTDADA